MEKQINSGAENGNRIRRIRNFLLASKSEKLLPSLFFAVLLFTPISRTVMTFLLPYHWQISGYYLDGLFWGLLTSLGMAWLTSIVLLFSNRQFEQGLKRTIEILSILLIGAMFWGFPRLFLPSLISGWPIDSVYSEGRGKYFILAYEPVPTDTVYRVYSVWGTRLNPIWQLELAGRELDYSEDGSLTENPNLILSKDEQVLVISRGGQLTDAVLLESKQPLTNHDAFCDEDREQQWLQRTDAIRNILSVHDKPASSSAFKCALIDIPDAIEKWCKIIAPKIAHELPEKGWKVTCRFEEAESMENGLHRIWFKVICQNGNTNYEINPDMSLAKDANRLVIVEHASGRASGMRSAANLARRRDARHGRRHPDLRRAAALALARDVRRIHRRGRVRRRAGIRSLSGQPLFHGTPRKLPI